MQLTTEHTATCHTPRSGNMMSVCFFVVTCCLQYTHEMLPHKMWKCWNCTEHIIAIVIILPPLLLQRSFSATFNSALHQIWCYSCLQWSVFAFSCMAVQFEWNDKKHNTMLTLTTIPFDANLNIIYQTCKCAEQPLYIYIKNMHLFTWLKFLKHS